MREPLPADPPHPLPALTTYELSRQRRELERAIAFFGRKTPVPPTRDDLQAKLDAVVAEQEERERIRHLNA